MSSNGGEHRTKTSNLQSHFDAAHKTSANQLLRYSFGCDQMETVGAVLVPARLT
jgi:hypothetical protein